MQWRAILPLFVVAGLPGLLAAGCAGPRVYSYTPEALRAELRLRAPDLRPHELIVPFEVDPADVEFARARVPRHASSEVTVQALVDTLTDRAAFGLRYDWARTADARSTLASRRGNCMSLASVLVGLARGLGMHAYYAEAVRYRELQSDDDLRIWSGHMAVVIVVHDQRAVVDFSGQLPDEVRFRRIDDVRALAHFYNNLGFQQVREARLARVDVPWLELRRQFEIATRIDPGFGQAWNSLGVAHARSGDLEAARDMYRTAIEVDPGLRAARENLDSLRARLDDGGS